MKISIITPSYNQEEFIERTMMSVLSQKWDFEIEYIIMDGWSTDKSIEIIKRIESDLNEWKIKKQCKDIEIIWKSEKDKWQSDAINKWLKIATWKILTYLNSDDTLEPWALELVVNNLWKSKKSWSYGKCRIIDKEDKEIREWITLYKNILWRNFSYSRLLTENFISQMTVFWKREVMEKCWYFDENEHLCMDYEYWLRIGEHFEPLYIPEYIADFRFYQTSKSWAHFDKQFKDELRLAKKYARWWYKRSLLVHKFNYYKIIWIYKILSFIKK
jgi:glycosyltransferase involved in cell wall biosynthesis